MYFINSALFFSYIHLTRCFFCFFHRISYKIDQSPEIKNANGEVHGFSPGRRGRTTFGTCSATAFHSFQDESHAGQFLQGVGHFRGRHQIETWWNFYVKYVKVVEGRIEDIFSTFWRRSLTVSAELFRQAFFKQSSGQREMAGCGLWFKLGHRESKQNNGCLMMLSPYFWCLGFVAPECPCIAIFWGLAPEEGGTNLSWLRLQQVGRGALMVNSCELTLTCATHIRIVIYKQTYLFKFVYLITKQMFWFEFPMLFDSRKLNFPALGPI